MLSRENNAKLCVEEERTVRIPYERGRAGWLGECSVGRPKVAAAAQTMITGAMVTVWMSVGKDVDSVNNDVDTELAGGRIRRQWFYVQRRRQVWEKKRR